MDTQDVEISMSFNDVHSVILSVWCTTESNFDSGVTITD